MNSKRNDELRTIETTDALIAALGVMEGGSVSVLEVEEKPLFRLWGKLDLEERSYLSCVCALASSKPEELHAALKKVCDKATALQDEEDHKEFERQAKQRELQERQERDANR